MESDSRPPFLERHDFLIHRLHSLSGLVPVGAFLCMHLAVNASVLDGANRFQHNVDQIHSLGSAVTPVEWIFIFIPLIFHAVVGVAIIGSGQQNYSSYQYVGNFRYMLQRITAWIALLFILAHVFHLHGWLKAEPLESMIRSMGGAQFDHYYATSTAAEALQGSILIQLAYAVGVLATVFHFANGLWTMGITWGVWTTPSAQRRANYFCGGLGVVLAALGLGALVGLVNVDVDASRQFEEQLNESKIASGQVTEEEIHQHDSDDSEEEEPATRARATSDSPGPHDGGDSGDGG